MKCTTVDLRQATAFDPIPSSPIHEDGTQSRELDLFYELAGTDHCLELIITEAQMALLANRIRNWGIGFRDERRARRTAPPALDAAP